MINALITMHSHEVSQLDRQHFSPKYIAVSGSVKNCLKVQTGAGVPDYIYFLYASNLLRKYVSVVGNSSIMQL